MSEAISYSCPTCGESVAVTPQMEAQSCTCPHCGGGFIVEPSAEALESIVEHQDEEISTRRIRQIVAEKRAAYRMRSYAIMAAAAFAVVTVQLAYSALKRARSGWDVQTFASLIFACIAFVGAGAFARHAISLHQRVKHKKIEEPTTPPDFSQL